MKLPKVPSLEWSMRSMEKYVRKRTFEKRRLFGTSLDILSTKLAGTSLRLAADLEAKATVGPVGPCSSLRKIPRLSFRNAQMTTGLTLYAGKTAVVRLKKDLVRRLTTINRNWYRVCVSVKGLQLCMNFGGKLSLSIRGISLEVWATGSVGVRVAEAGVRASGKLLDIRPSLSVQQDSSGDLRAQYAWTVHPVKVWVGLVYRTRKLRHSRRRRFFGRTRFAWGGWKTIKKLYDYSSDETYKLPVLDIKLPGAPLLIKLNDECTADRRRRRRRR